MSDELRPRLEQQLLAISRTDTLGKTVPSIRSNMDASADFRKEMAHAVQSVLPPQRGKLRIKNETGKDQHLLVEGVRWLIPASSDWREINVPVGTITTELAPHEKPKTWAVGPPSYVQLILIQFPGTAPSSK